MSVRQDAPQRKDQGMNIERQARATVTLKEAIYELIALGFTFKDITEIVSDTGDEYYQAREFDNDPDLQTDR